MAWSDVAIFVGGVALGALGVGGYYERAARIAAEHRVDTAGQLAPAQVSAERRLTAAAEQRDRGKEIARAAVADAGLAGCPIPADLGELLVGQALATRSGARGDAVPDRAVPGPGTTDVRGREPAR